MAVENSSRISLEQVIRAARKERAEVQREYGEINQQMHGQQEIYLMETMQMLRGWYQDVRECLDYREKGVSRGANASRSAAQMDREVDRLLRQNIYEISADSLRSPRYWWHMENSLSKFVIYPGKDDSLKSALPKAKWENREYVVFEYREDKSIRTEITFRIRWIAGRVVDKLHDYQFSHNQCMEIPVEWSEGMKSSFGDYERLSEQAAYLARGHHELGAIDELGARVLSEKDQLDDYKNSFQRETAQFLRQWYLDFAFCVINDETTATGELLREGKGEIENLRRDVERLRAGVEHRVNQELNDRRLWRHMQDLSQRYELLDVHDERQEKDEIHKRIRKVAREIFPYLTRRGYQYTNCWESLRPLRWTQKMEDDFREYGQLSDALGAHLGQLAELWRIHEVSRSRNQVRRGWGN